MDKNKTNIKTNIKKNIKKTCPCCYETIGKLKIECPKCTTLFCIKCVKTFLLSLEKDTAECMSCHSIWTDDFIRTNMQAKFYKNEYPKYKAEVQYNMARNLFARAMPMVKREITVRKNQELIDNMKKDRSLLYKKIRNINFNIRDLERQNNRLYNNKIDQILDEDSIYSIPCPSEKGCKGFVNNKGKCGMCDINVCIKCNCILNKDNKDNKDNVEENHTSAHTSAHTTTHTTTHICKLEDVESVKMINRDTVPCPKCKVRIHKIAGCSHMFCNRPGCFTSFDWNTGREISDSINTNPHYYAYQASLNNGRVPRDPRDIPCGGLPHVSYVTSTFSRFNTTGGLELYQSITHNERIILPSYRPVAITDNMGLIVKHLIGDYNEEKFKSEIKKINKKREKNLAVYPILDNYIQIMTEFIRQIVNIVDLEEFKNIINQMFSLREYTNVELEKVRKRFDNIIPEIEKNWALSNPERPGKYRPQEIINFLPIS
jgi:hypothetical protein